MSFKIRPIFPKNFVPETHNLTQFQSNKSKITLFSIQAGSCIYMFCYLLIVILFCGKKIKKEKQEEIGRLFAKKLKSNAAVTSDDSEDSDEETEKRAKPTSLAITSSTRSIRTQIKI